MTDDNFDIICHLVLPYNLLVFVTKLSSELSIMSLYQRRPLNVDHCHLTDHWLAYLHGFAILLLDMMITQLFHLILCFPSFCYGYCHIYGWQSIPLSPLNDMICFDFKGQIRRCNQLSDSYENASNSNVSTLTSIW